MPQADKKTESVSRRTLLTAGAGLAGGVVVHLSSQREAHAVAPESRRSARGPAGSEGDTVNVARRSAAHRRLCGAGEDELKGRQLAVEHINSGDRAASRRSRRR